MNTTASLSGVGGLPESQSAAEVVSTGCAGASRNWPSRGSATASLPDTTREGSSSNR